MMSSYIDKSDIEDVFGVENVSQWSQLDNEQASANDDRIDAAIAYAEQIVEDRFRGSRYQVPLSATAGTLHQVKHWCTVLAGRWLYHTRGLRDAESDDTLALLAEGVEREITDYVSGVREMAAAHAETEPTGPSIQRGG
jgi:phage gp36-like protein